MDRIDGQSTSFEDGIRVIFQSLEAHADRITAYEDRFLPGVLEDRLEAANDDSVTLW